MRKKQNGHGHHWSYEGEKGPKNWGNLSFDFILCKEGKRQSPVNINTANTERDFLPELFFNYDKIPLRMINNGHTIQINCNKGHFLVYDTIRYELLQIHFHRKSEHTVDGQHYDMEVQLIHRNEKGSILIVAVFLEVRQPNAAIEEIWKYIDEEEKPEFMVHGVFFDPVNLLPEDFRYYLYKGSTTVPGCDEGVTWIVMKEPVPISQQQIEEFELIFPDNFRPVQPLEGRIIKESK